MPVINLLSEHTTHSYIRSHTTDDGKKWLWKCAHPDCKHTMVVPIRNRSILIGKSTICPKCGIEKFVLTSKDVQLKTPICILCKGGKKAEEIQAARDVMAGVIDGLFNPKVEVKEK